MPLLPLRTSGCIPRLLCVSVRLFVVYVPLQLRFTKVSGSILSVYFALYFLTVIYGLFVCFFGRYGVFKPVLNMF